MNHQNLLREEYQDISLNEILNLPVTALLSVYGNANYTKDTLDELNIKTIFDLATSLIFVNADNLCNPLSEVRLLLEEYGNISSNILKLNKDFNRENISQSNIEILYTITDKQKDYLEKNLNITTLHHLANWIPYLQSKQLLTNRTEEVKDSFLDDKIPDELVPKFNQYPADSFSYTIYTQMPSKSNSTDLNDFEDALDLDSIDFTSEKLKIQVGGVLRFEQLWIAQGLALGDLLHSLPLAPGESTNIAIIDWSRQQGVKVTEDMTQLESLSNSIMQTRSLNEITQAVAREAQGGFSKINSNATVSNTAYSSYGVENIDKTLEAMADGAMAGVAGGALAGGVGGAGIGLVAGTIVPGLGSVVGGVSGGLIGAGSGAIIGGVSGAASAALATAKLEAKQENTSQSELETVTLSYSDGSRSISAETAQNITDRTLQHASASRNKKASIVREVTENEGEKITTRSITNYNHMHSLTIQYFEVIQLFESKTRLKTINPCIFIPFKNIEFENTDLERWKRFKQKYRGRLISSALTYPFLISLLQDRDIVSLQLNLPNNISKKLLNEISNDVSYQESLSNASRESNMIQYTTILEPISFNSEIGVNQIFEFMQIPTSLTLKDTFKDIGVSSRSVVLARRNDDYDPDLDVEESTPDPKPVESSPKPEKEEEQDEQKMNYDEIITYKIYAKDMFGKIKVLINMEKSGQSSVSYDNILLKNLVSIHNEIAFSKKITKDQFKNYLDKHRVQGTKIYHTKFGKNEHLVLSHGNKDFSIKVPCYYEESNINFNQHKIDIKVFDVVYGNTYEWQLEHFNDNSQYYTSQIFRNFTNSEYLSMLSSYKYEELELSTIVEPHPKAISGNYLIFKLRKTFKKHEEWMEEIEKEKTPSTAIVPIATGGVFSEAIQGRANSAEKLDITRFWNWQDSPIPNTAPEIAPIQSGTRATNPNLQSSGFDAPIVNISNPHPFPNPQGMSGVLSAVSSPNIFRDMSGMAQTAALAQAQLEAAMKASTEAGGQSSKNLENGLNFTKELASQIIKMTGDYGQSLADTGFGALTSGINSPQNDVATGEVIQPPADVAFQSPSMAGATLNQAKEMDTRDTKSQEESQKNNKTKKAKKTKEKSRKVGNREHEAEHSLRGGKNTSKQKKSINLSMRFTNCKGEALVGQFEVILGGGSIPITLEKSDVGAVTLFDIDLNESPIITIIGEPFLGRDTSSEDIDSYWIKASKLLIIKNSNNILLSIQRKCEIYHLTMSSQISDTEFSEKAWGVNAEAELPLKLISSIKAGAKFESKWGDSHTDSDSESKTVTVYVPTNGLLIEQIE